MARRGSWGKSSEISFDSRDSFRERQGHTGGNYSAGDEGGDPCACGIRCAERDYEGSAKRGPRAFCVTDTRFIARAITELPWDYVELWLRLPRSDQAGERVSGSKEPPIPLDADVQAFMREIVHVAVSWEEAVGGVARLASYPEGHRRDSAALRDACQTLTTHLDTLCSLEAEVVTRYVSPNRLAQLDDDELLDDPYLIWWDTSGDAWMRQTMDGTRAALELLALHGRARGKLGLNRGRLRITEVACDECKGSGTLIQPEAKAGGLEPRVQCTICPNVYVGARFDLLMARVYQAQMAALDAHERQQRDTRAA